MTRSAAKMVSPVEFEQTTGKKVYVELFEKDFDYRKILKARKVEHILLADSANIFVVAPATANTIAKIAHGIAVDFLTTTLLATQAPVLVCPSMNVHMWQNPVVQKNIQRLKQLGFYILHPDEGDLACGYRGVGRLPNPQEIIAEIKRLLTNRTLLTGKKVLVTAGATREPIDDVRFITNRSSGKMGVALAESCHLRGVNVLLVRAKTAVKPRVLLPEETFATVDDLAKILKSNIPQFDVCFHTAAVSDFTLQETFRGKISSKRRLTLKLKPQKKIIDMIKKINPRIKLIAFKAEWRLKELELIKRAYEKLTQTKADAVVVNDVGRKDRGFEVDTNEVYIVLPNQSYKKIPLASKRKIADNIVNFTVRGFSLN